MNWIVNKFKQLEKEIMTDVSGIATTTDPSIDPATPEEVIAKASADTVIPPAPPLDPVSQLVDLLKPQIADVVKTAVTDALKGNFAGIVTDTKNAAVNYAIQDAASAGKALEQMVYNHISTLGVSKELDVAKGKITDAFMWIEKHLGISS
jgi:hypothetical protein